MPPSWLPDDETIDAILAGDEVDARFGRIAEFARRLRRLGDGPPPRPTPALEAALARGRGCRRRRRGRSPARPSHETAPRRHRGGDPDRARPPRPDGPTGPARTSGPGPGHPRRPPRNPHPPHD